MKTDSLLGHALLGLLWQQPQSGYDLRKVFATTAMGSFSDSPGAIYPALTRLEKRKLVRGTIEDSAGIRRKRTFRITAKGEAELKTWLAMPIVREDIVRGMHDDLMLRFAFMDQTLGEECTARFLTQMAAQIAEYIPELRRFHASNAQHMPLSAGLALECGIRTYEAQLHWAKSSLATYQRRKRKMR